MASDLERYARDIVVADRVGIRTVMGPKIAALDLALQRWDETHQGFGTIAGEDATRDLVIAAKQLHQTWRDMWTND